MIGRTLGHYIVHERIGAGGMGEVFRAHDQHLERDVALKILPSGFLADEAARKRFRREALALSKLNHPNVATVFDFDTQGDVDFLVMELIRGKPLTDRLKEGPLPEREVLRLGIQFADGLAAAHAQGVIHRDLKPGNLMITVDGRLKILDFGLALLVHLERDPDLTRSAVDATSFAGTVPYMPPEQLKGLAVDARSDIYAAGAVLYEMATGQRPFPHSQSAELIGAILHQEPAPPSTHNRKLTAGLDSIVMKALDKEAANRYRSAGELMVALDGVSSSVTATRKRWPVAAVVATVAAGLIAGLIIGLNVGGVRDHILLRTARNETAKTSVASVRPRRAVAVLGFQNLSGRSEAAWLSTAFAEMLTTELAAGENVRTIPGETVSRMKAELSLGHANALGQDTLSRIRRNVGADFVVLGSYVVLGSERQLRFDLRLQDTASGEAIASVAETGLEAQLFDLVSRSGLRLREKLGIGALSPAQATEVRAALPANAAAARLYSEGLDRLRVFDYVVAQQLFARALAIEPGQAMLHSAEAQAWSSLGYDARARAAAKKAFDNSSGLPREERLSIEARYHEIARDWNKAIDIYRTLSGFFPDNLEYGLRLAAAQTSGGRPKDAVTTIEALRRSQPAADDPRLDLSEASAARLLSDNKRAQQAAAAAAAKSQERGEHLLSARARFEEGSALQNLGQLDQARTVLEESHSLFLQAGDRLAAARALNNIALVFAVRGDLANARSMFENALKTYQQIGNKNGKALMTSNIGNIHYMQGDFPRARRLWEDALSDYRDIDEKEGMARMLNNLGSGFATQGGLADARKMFEQSLDVYRQMNNRAGIAVALSNLGGIMFDLGDLGSAHKLRLEALSLQRSLGDKAGVSESLYNIGGIETEQGDITAAKARFEESLSIRQEIQAPPSIAVTRLALASLLFEEHRLKEAETAARELVEAFQRLKNPNREASAHALLADCLLEQNRVTEAQRAVEQAEKLARQSKEGSLPLFVTVTAARIRAAAGRRLQAAQDLKTALERMSTANFLSRLEARLILAKFDLEGPNPEAARSRLESLGREAAASGFRRLAQKAADARGPVISR